MVNIPGENYFIEKNEDKPGSLLKRLFPINSPNRNIIFFSFTAGLHANCPDL